MISDENLRIAIIGDPHFYREGDKTNAGISHIRLNESGDFIQRQGNQNPWIGVQNLVESQNLQADILICVGDITYGADRVGLSKAWSELHQLGKALGAKHVLSATGNHDVSSRSMAEKVGRNPPREMSAALGLFEPLKLLSPPYPVIELGDTPTANAKLLRTKYFGDSLVLVETERYRIIVLNSCCEHSADAHQYERGSFPESAQAVLLEELESSKSEKINILVCHHSPEPHSTHNLGGHDFIENGDALLEHLEQHGSWLVIHGHKHHASLTYSKGGSSAPVVFSAASLGMQIDSSKEGMCNQFYCVDLKLKSSGCLQGKVAAWTWNFGLGWQRSVRSNGGIYDGSGFGANLHVGEVAQQIAKLVPCNWQLALSQIGELEYLIPSEMKSLESRLFQKHNVVVQPDTNGYWTELLPKL